jgi:tetratricopeptide (TPR) repeat protein
VRWRQAALRLLPDEASEQRRELTEELAGTLLDIGRLQEGRDLLLDALDRTAGRTARARLVIACAAVEHFIGHHLAAERRLVQALAEVPDGPTPESAAMRVELATSAAHRALFALSSMRAQQAAEDAVRIGHPALTAVASAVDAFGQVCTAADGAADALTRAVRMVDELSDEQLSGHLEALFYAANAAHWGEHYGIAERIFRRGLALARSAGRGHLLVSQLAGLAHTLVALGRLAEAAEQSEAAVDAARLGGVPLLLAWALGNQAWTVAAAGELDQALALGAEAVTLLDGVEGGALPASVRGHLAAIHLEAGDPQRCVAQMQAAGAPDFPQFSVDRRLIWYAVLVEAELGRGRRDAAESWARRGVQQSIHALPVAGAAVTRARALLVLDADRGGAAALALTAAAGAESRGARLEAARSRAVAGRALAAAGNRRRARDELRAARAQLAACGSPHCPPARARSPSWWPTGARTGRSRPRSSSPRRPSRAT